MNEPVTEDRRIADIRETIEAWRNEARQSCYEIDNALDVEWLGGRIAALSEVLNLLDGRNPPTIGIFARLLEPT